VKVYVPAGIFCTVIDSPVPDSETFPGFLVSVHVPDDGNPERTTLPVGTVQFGCVTVPGTGADGIATTVSE
jgi:hypothetical protein